MVENTLKEYSKKDMEYGCLLILKREFCKILDIQAKMDLTFLGLFQLNDFKKCSISDEISSDMAIKAMDLRQKHMRFPRAKLYEEGGDVIDNEIDKIRDAILNKANIVVIKAQEDFQFFVK